MWFTKYKEIILHCISFLFQAYRNYGTRINNLRKKLSEVRRTLPDPLSPIPSPTLDAPSPAASPAPRSTEDNTEMMDMDMSDDEEAGKTGTD